MSENKPDKKPSNAELLFLSLAFDKFINLYNEIQSNDFWKKEDTYRLMKIREIFSVYNEMYGYSPKWNLNYDALSISKVERDLFKFIRNYLSHFPFFNSWNEIWIQRDLLNWKKRNGTMHKFLTDYEGHKPFEYIDCWDLETKEIVHITFNFPKNYSLNEKIYLKDMVSEKEGVKFSVRLMMSIVEILMWGNN